MPGTGTKVKKTPFPFTLHESACSVDNNLFAQADAI
jgi:hypothetical protein